jgi:hypothetical protein
MGCGSPWFTSKVANLVAKCGKGECHQLLILQLVYRGEIELGPCEELVWLSGFIVYGGFSKWNGNRRKWF